jgi:hypothetical protein
MASLKKCLELDAKHVQHARRVEEAEIHNQTPIRRIWRYSGGPLIPLIVGVALLGTFTLWRDKALPQLPPNSAPARVW